MSVLRQRTRVVLEDTSTGQRGEPAGQVVPAGYQRHQGQLPTLENVAVSSGGCIVNDGMVAARIELDLTSGADGNLAGDGRRIRSCRVH